MAAAAARAERRRRPAVGLSSFFLSLCPLLAAQFVELIHLSQSQTDRRVSHGDVEEGGEWGSAHTFGILFECFSCLKVFFRNKFFERIFYCLAK
jgi:hypothetical protein